MRVDSIEQAIGESAAQCGSIDDQGYRAAYAIAEDNLRIGRTVIADSVNPLTVTRDAWRAVANRTGAAALEVEISCSDATEHRRRIETRIGDIAGLRLLTWEEVVHRDYEVWSRDHLMIDTAEQSIGRSVRMILSSR